MRPSAAASPYFHPCRHRPRRRQSPRRSCRRLQQPLPDRSQGARSARWWPAGWLWPSILPIGKPIPLDAATLARACRKSCNRISSGPAAARIAHHGFSRLTRAVPSSDRRSQVDSCGAAAIRRAPLAPMAVLAYPQEWRSVATLGAVAPPERRGGSTCCAASHSFPFRLFAATIPECEFDCGNTSGIPSHDETAACFL